MSNPNGITVNGYKIRVGDTLRFRIEDDGWKLGKVVEVDHNDTEDHFGTGAQPVRVVADHISFWPKVRHIDWEWLEGRTMNRNDSFWIVWNPAAGDRPPTKKFSTEKQARAVAKSMAEENPGESFIVLKAVSKFYLPESIIEERFDEPMEDAA